MIARRLLPVAIAVVAMWVAYRALFPNDEAQIRDALNRIAAAAGAGAAQQSEVSRLARAASVRSQLDPNVTVEAGPPFGAMSGREAILGAIARINGTVSELDISFDDVMITVDSRRTTAKVHLTAEARYRESGGDSGLDARELDLTFRRLDGSWVVSDVAFVRTLNPFTPR